MVTETSFSQLVYTLLSKKWLYQTLMMAARNPWVIHNASIPNNFFEMDLSCEKILQDMGQSIQEWTK